MAASADRPLGPRSTVLSAAIWEAAERGDAAEVEALLEREGYSSPDCRSMYQSTLLHCAAKHGHLALAAALLSRGADVNALDYGGMRRTPLHWACKGGHVAMVELLVASGADTKADGRSWSKLVQGSRCGSLIPKDSPTESAEALCRTNAVRLALTQPRWEPSLNHHMWPERFKSAVRLLLLASCSAPHSTGAGGGQAEAAAGSDSRAPGTTEASCGRSSEGRGDASREAQPSCACAVGIVEGQGGGSGGGSGASGAGAGGLSLAHDTLLEVLRLAAYPISSWM